MRRVNPAASFVAPQLTSSDRLAIGEAPGQEEDAVGKPFVGGSGRVLEGMYAKIGVKKAALNIINVLQCKPPGNVFPTDPEARAYISAKDADEAVEHCLRNHVRPLLRARKWKRIDTFGSKPLKYILGKDEGVFTWRGSPLPVPELGPEAIAVPTLHPAYLVRDQAMLPAAINDLNKSTNVPPEHYTIYPSLEQVKEFKHEVFAFDIESNRATNEIIMVGLCAKPWYSMSVPFRGPYIAELKRIFKNAKTVIGHNCIQFDLPYLQRNGVVLDTERQGGVSTFDTMLMQHLLFPDFPHDLGFVGSQFVNKPAWKELPKPDYTEFARYCCRDTDVTMCAYLQLLPMLRKEKLLRLYELVQVPLARICLLMHQTGFQVDPNRIGKVRDQLHTEMAELELKLPEALRTHDVPIRKREPAPAGTLSEKTGKPLKFIMVDATETVVPWRSSQEVARYLYEVLQLPVQKHIKTGNTTANKGALDKLFAKTHNPVLLAVRRLRGLDELETTFCKEEMLKVEKMYPHFNVHGTNSGRLSSSDPNLQNIPESTRHIYVPSVAGWKIIDVDYSGIESRITAYLANDAKRLANYLSIPGYSEHKFLASRITGLPYEAIKKSADPDSPYSKAKHVVHGFNYGLGVRKCSMMYDMDFKETKKLFEMWAGEIPDTVRWREATAAKAKQDGFLTTPFGRKRWFYTSSAYTESLSFLPQSTAADIIFRAMIGLMYERIQWPLERVLEIVRIAKPLPQPARLLISVHDSLVFEAPAGMVDDCVELVRCVMEQPWPELGGFSIPIGVKVGDSWGGE